MTISINATEFDLLRQLIEQECGIAVGEDKVYLLESRLSKLVVEQGCDNFSSFYYKAKSDAALRDKIVDAMTTNETLWFRDNAPYITLQEKLFPQFVEQLRKGQKKEIRIWSAACSTGQEPYSIAMLAHEFVRLGGGPELCQGGLKILATDISPSALFLAKTGRYDPVSMSRGMPDDLKQRYFENNGRTYVLKNEIKSMVQFQQVNLLNSFEHLGLFDLILLRNVAIYFSTDFKISLFKRLANALYVDGYLFLGSSESMLGYSQDFQTLDYKQCHYYQVKPGVRT